MGLAARRLAVTRASVFITFLAMLLAGCDNPFGPSETDLQYGLDDVAMVSQGGVDLNIRFDVNVRGFDGRLVNTMNVAVSARVVVSLSNGRTYDQVFDLAPGEVHYVRISTFLDRFTSWDVELSV